MWLINSSIGRKVIMSVTGIALILFLTFHMSMNIVALFSGKAYNMICEFLGANWYAVVATVVLGALTVVHIVYAFILTAQNRKARGSERYAVNGSSPKVEWASKNMLVLGIIILLGLFLHLFNFWYNMMFAELFGTCTPYLPSDGFAYIKETFANPVYVVLYIIWLCAIWFHLSHLFNFWYNMMFAELFGTCTPYLPSDGFAYIKETFANPVYVVLYIIWLCAIWFHLSHGFWSAMQTIGINGKIWFNRWRIIGLIYTSLLMLGFLIVVLAFAFGCAPSVCCAA